MQAGIAAGRPSTADQADPAGAEGRLALVEAERRDPAPGGARGLQDRRARPRPRPSTPSTVTVSSLTPAPARRGSGSSRLRIGAGMPPPWAQRLPSSSASSSASKRARSTGALGGEHLVGAAQADPAGEALAAALVGAEVQQVAGDVAHVRRLVEGEDRSRGRPCSPRRRAASKSKAVSSRDAGQDAAERAADLHRLDRCGRRAGRRRRSSQSSRTRHAERDLVDARAGEALVEADELRAGGRAVGAEGAVGVGAAGGDEGDVAERLDVVDDGRHAVDAALGRERRARRDRAAQALQAGEQRRLLADDVGAGALDDGHVEGEAAAEDVGAEQALLAGPRGRGLERGLESGYSERHEDEAVLGADRVAREGQALEQQLRVALHQVLVDVGARVALVAVGDDELLVALGGARRSAHLVPGREAGAAAAADARPPRPRRAAPRGRARRARAAGPTSRRGGSGPARGGGSPLGLGGVAARAGEDALDDARARRRSTSPTRTAGEEWQKPRQTVSARETAPSVAALAERRGRARRGARRRARRRWRRSRRCRCRRGRGARRAARAGRRRRWRRRRRRPRAGRRARRRAAVVVGDLAAGVHRLLQHLERGRRLLRVVAADQLDESSRHVLSSVVVQRIAVKVIPTTSR